MTISTAIAAIISQADALSDTSTAEDLVYLAKSLQAVSDTTQVSTEAVQAVVDRVNALSASSTAEDLIYLAKSVEALQNPIILSDITTEGNLQYNRVLTEGNTQDLRVTDEGGTQYNRVLTEGNTQTLRTTEEGDAQDLRVTDEGDTQVSRVTAEGDLQINRVILGWTSLSASSTLQNNYKYAVDFTNGPLTLTLPAASDADDYIELYRSAGVAEDSIIARNGNTIMASAEDLTIDVEITSLHLIYNGSDWRIL